MELASLKTYGVILEKEFENLNTVIMLPPFGLRVMDTGESLSLSSGLAHASSRSSLVHETEAQKFLSIHLVVPSPLTSSLSLLLARPAHPSLVLGARGVEMNGDTVTLNPAPTGHRSLIWVLPGDEDTEKPLASSSNRLDRPSVTRLLGCNVSQRRAAPHGQDAVGTQVRGSSLSLRGGLLEGLDRGRTQEDSPKLLRQRRAQRSTRWGEVSEGSEHVQAASHAGLVPTPFSEENVTSTTSL